MKVRIAEIDVPSWLFVFIVKLYEMMFSRIMWQSVCTFVYLSVNYE
jgi:hypothetical protein